LLNKLYKYAIGYFLLFSLLLLASGALLFDEKIGFSYTDIVQYYLGNPDTFAAAKSVLGVSKIILPHIFSFGLFIMVLLHFLIFTKKRNTITAQVLISLSFSSAFLELFSPFAILAGAVFFAFVKLLAFFLFELTILYILFILFKSIVYNK